MDQGKLYEKQVSLTEWFEGMGYTGTKEFRDEDNEKRERLGILRDICGIPFDQGIKFDAYDLTERKPHLVAYVEAHGDEHCAIRLIPKTPEFEKLRVRGKTVREALQWFDEQKIDPNNYRVEYLPHSEAYLWSTIFVVTDNGVFGEIVPGVHAVLTQGIYDGIEPIQFSYDFSTWSFSRENKTAEEEMKKIVGFTRVPDEAKKKVLTEKLSSSFAGDHLKGYFESVTSADFGFWMCDYNRILGGILNEAELPVFSTTDEVLKGQVGSVGHATGRVRIVSEQDIASAQFENGDVLVCKMTTPMYLPLMQKASAVVTEQGGVLSHAAIVCRELKLPCIVGVKNVLEILKDGDQVAIDTKTGTIKKI
jgi:phosphohistidine swiveling domain-containing protein